MNLEHDNQTEVSFEEAQAVRSHLDLKLVIDKYENIGLQLIGYTPLNPLVINSLDKYSELYKTRHDLIHQIICSKLNITFGEEKFKKVFENVEWKDNTFYNEICEQTPDHISVNGSSVIITEVTISMGLNAKEHKISKYSLMAHFLRTNKYNVQFRIFAINPLSVYQDRDIFILQGLNDLSIMAIKVICDRSLALLRYVHSTEQGSQYYMEFNNIMLSDVDLKFDVDTVVETHKKFNSKCFFSEEDVKKVLLDPYSVNTHEFMNRISEIALKLVNPLCKKDTFNPNDFLQVMRSKSNSKHFRSVMPLPYISSYVKDSSERSTLDDFHITKKVASELKSSNDELLKKFGDCFLEHMESIKEPSNYDFGCEIHLSAEEKSDLAIDGPGRKRYIRSGSTIHINEQKKYNGLAIDPMLNVSEVSEMMFMLSRKSKVISVGDRLMDMEQMSNLGGVGLDYVKVAQSIFRELLINSLRADRRKKYCLKPTGVDGVFVLIYPGPKLRCGELANICWFKVLIQNRVLIHEAIQYSPFFKKIIPSRYISYSEWLSTDIHRLEHYLRCYDKILMAYMSYITLRSRPDLSMIMINKLKESKFDEMDVERVDFKEAEAFSKNIETEFVNRLEITNLLETDDTDVLGLIISIFMEDRRSTSKMIQNVRYLVMTSISIYPKYSDVFDKMSDAIRSPLQLYLLNRSLDYYRRMQTWSVKESVKFGKIYFDPNKNIYRETLGGSIIMLPSPFSQPDRKIEFHEVLCEMYFTMLFNKNQDDPTHSSFQVLDKIIEGEANFEKVKEKSMHLGYHPEKTDLEFAELIMSEPSTHQFSRAAIILGTRFHRERQADGSNMQIEMACKNPNVNKTLDEFATYKSSSIYENSKYNGTRLRQNERRKCIDGVMELLKDGNSRSFDVVHNYKDEETHYQVFKKNQIGGVREILILPITNRIRLNVIESVSKNICVQDSREILTHGKTKNDAIKSCLMNSKMYPSKRASIHITMDKSKWGPSFVPIQFIYLFTEFKSQLGPLLPYFCDLLIRHQNKKCLMPDRLLRAWFIDDMNSKTHSNPLLQSIKEKFLKTKDLTLTNESNMGQGILHFTSSYLHLCMISFRDKLYEVMCKKINLNSDDHQDILSSDDSYTIFSPEIRGKNSAFIRLKLELFLKAQYASELLFNCRTSSSKSSINPLIGEFNSIFVSNLGFAPSLMKFAVSSVHPVNSDSFTRMVKESYSSCRSIMENGGTLDLYYLSHILNKSYCESIYHTNDSGQNSLSTLGLKKVPFQVGFYPVFEPSLMLIFGPEYWNYKLYKENYHTMNDDEKKLFENSHKLISGDLIDYISELDSGEIGLGGLVRIEAMTGPIRQLKLMRGRSMMSADKLNQIIEEDPMIMFRRPITHSDIIFRTCHKLFVMGAKEAVKMISPALYYGRVSASVSKNVFMVVGTEVIDSTFRNCVRSMIKSPRIDNFSDHLKFIYPRWDEYTYLTGSKPVEWVLRNPLEIQTVVKLSLHKTNAKLLNPIVDILDCWWFKRDSDTYKYSKILRDIRMIQSYYPMMKDSVQETKDVFSGDSLAKTKGLIMLLMKIIDMKDKSFKGINYGSSSEDITLTLKNLNERNSSFNIVYRPSEVVETYKSSRSSYEQIYCHYNRDIVEIINGGQPRFTKMIKDEDLNTLFNDKMVSQGNKKKIFMFIADKIDAPKWTKNMNMILHLWLKKQHYNGTVYTGNFSIDCFSGDSHLIMSKVGNKYKIQQYKVNDPRLLHDLLNEALKHTNVSYDDLLKNTEQGEYSMIKNKILKVQEGFRIDTIYVEPEPFPHRSYIELVGRRVKLLSDKDNIIYTMDLNFLPTRFVPEDHFQCKIYGLKFVELCKIGAFAKRFDDNTLFIEEKMSCFDDLKVEKPSLKDKAISKLGLTWDNDHVEEEEKVVIESDDIEIDYMSSFMLEEDEIMIPQSDDILTTDLMDFCVDDDFISSLMIKVQINQNQRLYERIRTLKYILVAGMLVRLTKINKATIKIMKKMIKEEEQPHLYWCLYYAYSEYNKSETDMSPMSEILVDDRFFDKYIFNE